MATLPRPTIGLEPPQPIDIGRLLALKSMLGQQQMQQQEIAVKQQQMNDLQATTSAMKSWDGKNYDELAKSVLNNGGSAAAATGIQQHGLTIKKTVSDIAAQDAATGSKNLETFIGKHKAIGDALEGIEQVPDEQLHQSALDKISDLTNAGIFDPQKAQALAQQVQSVQDPKQLRSLLEITAREHEGAQYVAAQAKTAAETAQASSAAAKNTAEMQGLTGPFAEAKYRNILGNMIAGKPTSDDDLTFVKGYEAANAKKTTQSDTLGVTTNSISGPAGLTSVGNRQGGKFMPQGSAPAQAAGGGAPQSTKDSLVDLIGQYKADPTTLSRVMMRHPDVLAMVHAKYPDWDQTSYQAKNKMVQSYTSGPESKSINAISTALGHAGELGNAIDALGNSDGLNALRALGNKLGVSVVGNDKVTAFNLIVHRLAPEITEAYVQGGGGEGERISSAQDFAASLGDKQLRSNLSETVKLLRSKISAQEQQWNNTYKPTRPEDDFSTRFLTPGAKDALQKYSPQAGGSAGGATQHIAGGPAQGLQEGATGKGSDGKPYIVKGGKWVPAQ